MNTHEPAAAFHETAERRTLCCFGILTVLLVMLLTLNLLAGSSRITPGEAFSALFRGEKGETSARIIRSIRLPRLLASRKLRNMALLVVCGVMIGYVCSAITEIAVTFADDSNIVNLHNWSMGSFSGIDMADVAVLAGIVFPAVLLAFLLSKPMAAYQLGEAYARSMGVNLRRFRAALILLSSVLSACVTAFAGPISFVGIAVPHLMRSFFRTAKPILMVPACFLGGGVFCLSCDLIARTLFAPTELSISTVTAVFGAPVVIWMLLTRKRGDTR